jgi:hypothetical protein
MIARANELVAGFDPELEQQRFSVFTTKEEQTHAKVGLPESLFAALFRPSCLYVSGYVLICPRCDNPP